MVFFEHWAAPFKFFFFLGFSANAFICSRCLFIFPCWFERNILILEMFVFSTRNRFALLYRFFSHLPWNGVVTPQLLLGLSPTL